MTDLITKRTLWSPNEIDILIKNYPEGGVEACKAELPNRSIDSIKLKAQRLKIKRNKYWSEEEILLLKEFYPLHGGTYCEKLLPKRTYFAINLQASRLKLTAPSTLKTHEQYELELFNLESSAYPVEQYNGATTPILHECIKGHSWKASPSDILKGRGCPICATYGFNPDKPAILYYIKISTQTDIRYKIGITNRTVAERFNLDRDKTIEVLTEEYFDIGEEARSKEKQLLEKYKSYRCKNDNFLKSLGNTELFKIDVLSL